ncbi:hypothetical protein CSB62_22410 [Vibrio splendidus]|uniref:DUF3592 domain-containing protein n=1 Tax=Vibrio lentus TaxID=136468 RepID=A0A2N7IIM0_9VIBR|nr:hypothetical protein [Vibrio lentus]PHN83552.1 hypothetical protein CSB62_22410 [Vibrio splendidus]MDH5925590.1 hypothetical protein [Vibrio lentus]PME57238.1 hypothetical protein BCV33_10805 [Vibrio lentus]PMG60798.1 hypothetical protein BCU87_15295 [Vibrio lentus]PMH28289.1 hypothetical protein BCU71_06900 [Vibrio lentus]
MKEVVLFALLYLCFYGMSLLDSDLSSFTHNVSVINIESAYCEKKYRRRICESIFTLDDMPTRFRVDTNLSSGFEEGEIYYNRKVEVLFDPKNVLSDREPIEVSNIIKNGYSIYGSTKWLSGRSFGGITLVYLCICIAQFVFAIDRYEKKHNKKLEADS